MYAIILFECMSEIWNKYLVPLISILSNFGYVLFYPVFINAHGNIFKSVNKIVFFFT